MALTSVFPWLVLSLFSPALPADTDGDAQGEQCPDPTLGAYAVERNGEIRDGWVMTFEEDGWWTLTIDGKVSLEGTWWWDAEDPCLIHYENPGDNGGKGGKGDYRWKDGGWVKENSNVPQVTITLRPFL